MGTTRVLYGVGEAKDRGGTLRVRWSRLFVTCMAGVVVGSLVFGDAAFGAQAANPRKGSNGRGSRANSALSVPLYGHRSGGPSLTYDYNGGKVLLSSTADGTGSTTYATSIVIHVQHPDGSTADFVHDYQDAAVFVAGNGTFNYVCPGPPTPLARTDLSSFFARGHNRVTAIGYNRNEGICAGSDLGGGSVYLVPDFSENHRA
jgi:hypothetical protein